MTGDLHPHGQNSPDIPMSSIQNFFTLRFHFRRDIGMAGAETKASGLRLHAVFELRCPEYPMSPASFPEFLPDQRPVIRLVEYHADLRYHKAQNGLPEYAAKL